MSAPALHAHAFLVCANVSWDAAAGPKTSRTLAEVSYTYRTETPNGFPYQTEFWLFARLVHRQPRQFVRMLYLTLVWLDDPLLRPKCGLASSRRSRFGRRLPFGKSQPVLTRPSRVRAATSFACGLWRYGSGTGRSTDGRSPALTLQLRANDGTAPLGLDSPSSPNRGLRVRGGANRCRAQ